MERSASVLEGPRFEVGLRADLPPLLTFGPGERLERLATSPARGSGVRHPIEIGQVCNAPR